MIIDCMLISYQSLVAPLTTFFRSISDPSKKVTNKLTKLQQQCSGATF